MDCDSTTPSPSRSEASDGLRWGDWFVWSCGGARSAALVSGRASRRSVRVPISPPPRPNWWPAMCCLCNKILCLPVLSAVSGIWHLPWTSYFLCLWWVLYFTINLSHYFKLFFSIIVTVLIISYYTNNKHTTDHTVIFVFIIKF